RAPMCDLTHLSSWGNIPSAGLTMLYNALFSLTAIMFCLSLFLQLNQQRSEGVHGKLAKTSKTRELTLTNSQREEVKLNSCTWPQFHSFLPLFLNKCVLPFPPGNITVIPWTVSAQRGNTISQRENRIVVQEDGYYLVFGQVLFMGHVIQSWSSTEGETRPTELLRCLQDITEGAYDNTCYTAGTVHLLLGEELEMMIPCRPSALISLEADSTFFGVIQLN
uniref:THD domain-containing protein n=1 Tax=Xiphophorus couchianus TaxID=32473 RepID=A0A3B5LRJ6_9TELE